MKSYVNIKKSILDVSINKRTDVYKCGADNLYPSLVEQLLNISVTTKIATELVGKAIYGKAFGKIGRTIVNEKGQTLNEILRIASREYTKHNNVFIHVGYNGLFEIDSIEILPFTKVRIYKKDDKNYSGLFAIGNWENNPKKEDLIFINKYNPRKSVLKSQIGENLPEYNGQVLHIQKDTNSIYSLSDLNPVLADCLSEHKMQSFRCNNSDTGFVGVKMILTQKMLDEQKREFQGNLKRIEGVENSEKFIHLENASSNIDAKLDDQIIVKDFTSPPDDALFAYTDKVTETSICKALQVPQILVSPNDSSLFGNNGTAIREARLQLFESRDEEREMLTEAFQMLIDKSDFKINEDLRIVSPFEKEQTNTEVN